MYQNWNEIKKKLFLKFGGQSSEISLPEQDEGPWLLHTSVKL